MCGITGFIHFEKERKSDHQILKKMADSIAHRGPDGEGFYCNQNVALGHRRLSIIDLGMGDQPMFNEDKSITIIFNGEIYNYIELREELKKLGHSFSTHSDTEVIIKAYQQWGPKCLNKLNGMWAFALWDERNQQLFLSIDRIGEKPLYYSFADNTFLFGSEIKAIATYGVPTNRNTEILEIYLTLGYIPAPYTFYKNIFKLLPGHYVIVKDTNYNIQKYWDIPQVSEKEMRTDKKNIYNEFESLLYDSVKLRMRSDVPFGAFLSGGLDSASVVALMSSISSYPIQTFTIGFKEKAFDESNLANHVAKAFNTQHHLQYVTSDSFDDYLAKVQFHYDEPFGDSSAIPVGHVSNFARQKVKMVLTGDGGDEVLSGYTVYQGEKFASQFQRIPSWIRSSLESFTHFLARSSNGNLRYKFNRLNRVIHSSNLPFYDRLFQKVSWIEPSILDKLILVKDRIRFVDFLHDVFKNCRYNDQFYKLMYFHLKVSLPFDMLVKVDRMTMAHSLEARVPFLDYRLIELMTQVSKKIKMEGYERKSVLRNTVAKKLPSSILSSKKKGFQVPLREWFKDSKFETNFNRIYNISLLDRSIVKKIVDANRLGKEDYGNFLWMLFLLQENR